MLEHLFRTDDVHRMVPGFPVVRNMPYMVGHNVSVALDIANGTWCYPVLAQLPAECKFEEQYIEDATFDLVSHPAEVIWAHVPGKDFSNLFEHPAGVPGHAFPLIRRVGNGVVTLLNRRINVSMARFPITPACAITV